MNINSKKFFTNIFFLCIITIIVLAIPTDIGHAAEQKWDKTYSYVKNAATFSLGKTTAGNDVIIITNNDYTCSYVEKSFNVKKNTRYKASVYASMKNYAPDPAGTAKEFGCAIGKTFSYETSVQTTSDTWELLSYEFTTDNETTYTLALYNGQWNSMCKGTAAYTSFTLEEVPWEYSYASNDATIATDKTNVYTGCEYSVSLNNNNTGYSYVDKTFKVKKNTHYRARVKAYYSYFEEDPNATSSIHGAHIRLKNEQLYSNTYTSAGWHDLILEFDSHDNTEVTLELCNGTYYSKCKGWALFGDFKLEEYTGPKKNNKWNVLVAVVKNVKAPVIQNGEEMIYTGSFNDADANYLYELSQNLYCSFPLLSEDLMNINSMDFITIDSTITGLQIWNNQLDNYCLDFNLPCIKNPLEKAIDEAFTTRGKKYNQIIVFVPITPIAHGWLGLGGTTFNNINICQINNESGTDLTWYKNFNESPIMHEMLHGIERISNTINPEQMVPLHSNVDLFTDDYYQHGQNGWDGWGTWYSDYMRRKTPTGQGIHKSAFNVYNTNDYKTIYGSSAKEKYSIKDITTLSISQPKNAAYTGKAITPAIVIKDGKKTLKKGVDYTVRYINNTEIGYAGVIITGKGKYAGSAAKTFKIIPKKPAVSSKVSDGKYQLSWNSIKGADSYKIYYSTDNGKTYKLKKTVDASKTSVELSFNSKNIKLKVCASRSLYPQEFHSKFSNVTGD